jgi:hypothetical protein
MKKLCKVCLEIKALDKFSKNCVNDDGLSHMCKECCSQYRKFLREKHKREASRITVLTVAQDCAFSVSFN